MKPNILFLCCSIIVFAGCSKSKNNINTTPAQETYLNTTSGSTWTYHEIDSSGATPSNSDFTVTSTSEDTTISTKSYHIYHYSYGSNEYLNITGNSYYHFDSIPGVLGEIFERLYLKDDAAIGANWKQNISVTVSSIPIPLTISNTIAEKGISRTVNGGNYTGVIHVITSISSTAIPSAFLTSNIDSYYAPKYGLIENTTKIHLNYLGVTQNVNIETKLQSSVLK
ncbi:MAG: hypothetical protein Q8891_04905 [Bacteroidota bacterium]|nr:hypothetical protein [Bacteroidota bacterium]